MADASAWEPRRSFSLVFSNAVLQWIPDQAGLLARMWSWLRARRRARRPGARQRRVGPAPRPAPDRRELPPGEERFADLGEVIRYEEPPFYYETLAPLGGSVEVWETTYWHLLGSRAALIDWYSGTGMRPWLERLVDEAERSAFKEAVLEAAEPAYSTRSDGSVFFPFRRIFVTAVKAI